MGLLVSGFMRGVFGWFRKVATGGAAARGTVGGSKRPVRLNKIKFLFNARDVPKRETAKNSV